jgi:hypothetical protein
MMWFWMRDDGCWILVAHLADRSDGFAGWLREIAGSYREESSDKVSDKVKDKV